MPRCYMKVGFFFLRDCDQSGFNTCGSCGGSFCNDHFWPGSGFCSSCASRNAQDDRDYYRNDSWYYGYRDNYYSSNRYAPMYYGDSSSERFGDYDVRNFDSADEKEPEEPEEAKENDENEVINENDEPVLSDEDSDTDDSDDIDDLDDDADDLGDDIDDDSDSMDS